jgi:cytochrome c5
MLDKIVEKKLLSLMVGIAVCVLGGLGTEVVAQSNRQAESEQGMQVVGRACIQCHNLRYIQLQRKSIEKWRDTVYGMISQGAPVFPEEIEPLTAYLGTNFGTSTPPPAAPAPTAAVTPAPSGAVGVSEDAGRSILLRACQECHSLETVTGKAASQNEWREIILRMLTYGARLTPPEQEKLAEYLSKSTP